MAEALAMPQSLPFEQQLYARSPFGLVLTTAALFALMFGSFLAAASLEHVATIQRTAGGIGFSNAAWPALVLSLLCCSALVMQRYTRLAEARDAPAYAAILAGGTSSAFDVTRMAAPREARLVRSTLIGLAIGLAISAFVRFSELREGHTIPPATMLWFAAATTFLVVLFTRGVEQTRSGHRSYARMLASELKIDLLRIDTLSVLGRSAARSALIWFVVSAVACLFFVGGDLNWLTALLIVACVAVGFGFFVSVMSRIHKQIVQAKAAELEQVRRHIDVLRARMHEDDHAAARLHGMLAYEKRIAEAPEWPFDQTTLMRVGASALILTVPWFGQAIVQYLIERVAQR